MECLEQLKKLDIKEVSQKTHISTLEIEAILDKNFAKFNHPKAVGYVKIFQRDYGIDLSPWLEEYEGEFGDGSGDDGIFLISEEKEGASLKKKIAFVLTIIVIVGLGILFYTSTQLVESEPVSNENVQMVEEAKKKVAENKSIQEKELEEKRLEAVEEDTNLLEDNKTEAVEETVKEKPVVVLEEEKEPKEVVKAYIKSRNNLWVSIRNNITGKKFHKTFKGEHELDVDGSYTIIFGHGYFTLQVGDEVTNSRRAEIQQYRYENREFKKEVFKQPKKAKKAVVKKESNTTAESVESTETSGQ